MGHVPHLLIEHPWPGPRLPLREGQGHHLETVLRVEDGDPVGYTDGRGTLGAGTYLGGVVERGPETPVPRPSELVVVAAPPASRDRLRFMVEKLSELGVASLRFLEARYGQGRPPRGDKVRSWAVAGLEQSRGAWLMDTSADTVTLADLDPPYAVCDPAGDETAPTVGTVVVGPEGGWAPGEVPAAATLFSLGPTILRVETAALVAAARLVHMVERAGPDG